MATRRRIREWRQEARKLVENQEPQKEDVNVLDVSDIDILEDEEQLKKVEDDILNSFFEKINNTTKEIKKQENVIEEKKKGRPKFNAK